MIQGGIREWLLLKGTCSFATGEVFYPACVWKRISATPWRYDFRPETSLSQLVVRTDHWPQDWLKNTVLIS